jgi:hypothetical protein
MVAVSSILACGQLLGDALDVTMSSEAGLSDGTVHDSSPGTAAEGGEATRASGDTGAIPRDGGEAVGIADVYVDDVMDEGPWTPARLPGLALWLSADIGVITQGGTTVSTWSDQSANKNTATQSFAAYQPNLASRTVNGHAAISFGSGPTFLQVVDSPSLQWGTGDFTVEIVASFDPSESSSGGLLFAKQNLEAPYAGPSMWANEPLSPFTPGFWVGIKSTTGYYALSTPPFALDNGATHLFAGMRDGTSLEARIDGSQTAIQPLQPPPVDINATGQFLFIGGQPHLDTVMQSFIGNIEEIVAVGGILAPADLSRLESYLMTRYAL